MKVLISDKTKKLYLAEQDRWVRAIDHGRDFLTCSSAITHLTSQRMAEVELYCAFPNQEFDFILPLEAWSPNLRINERDETCTSNRNPRKR